MTIQSIFFPIPLFNAKKVNKWLIDNNLKKISKVANVGRYFAVKISKDRYPKHPLERELPNGILIFYYDS